MVRVWLALVFSMGVSSLGAQEPGEAQDAPAPEEIPAAEAPAAPVETIPVADAPAADGSAPTELEAITVTAGRRIQSIAAVPIAVGEVSGAAIDASVVRDTQSLVMVVPSLNIQYSGSEATSTIRIRGVGTGGSNPGFESSVGVFVDGVYLPRPGLALNDLLDIERVEVLRGPQGTLFGKNTTVGAIQIVTREPNLGLWQGDFSASRGSFDSQLYRGVLNIPVFDTFGLRLAGQTNRRDGYVTNTFNGEDYNDRDRYFARAQALYRPLDSLSLKIIGYTVRKNERCCVAPYTQYNPATAQNIEDHGGTVFDPPEEYRVAFDYTDTKSDMGEDSLSAHVNWQLGEYTLKALYSQADGFVADARDGDFSDVDVAYQPYVNAQTDISTAELSLQGEWNRLDWLVGAFWSDETVGAQAQTLLGEDGGSFLVGNGVPPGTALPSHPPGSGSTSMSYQDGTSLSFFTHNVLDLGAGFETTVGLRYLMEEKVGGGSATSTVPACTAPLIPGGTIPELPGVSDPGRTYNSLRTLCGADPYEQRYEDQRVTGTAALSKTFANDLYTYVSYAQGFKSGGINLNPASTVGGTFDFRPEEVDSYEAGLRWPLFKGLLLARATYFLSDLKDYQINAFDGTAFTVSNAGEVEVQGVEIETDWRLHERLLVRANYTLTDAIYGPGTDDPLLVGKQLTNSPKHVGQLSFNWRASGQPWSPFFSLAARYQSEVNTGVNLDPAKAQEAYTLVNGRVGLALPWDFELSLLGNNLTDVYYRQIIFDAITRPPLGATATPASFNGYPGNPRMLALELRKRF